MGHPLTNYPESTIRLEMEAICRSPTLARSPVMLRLLRYLVDQSLRGHGATLKSYAVAVEGLGRESDFDALSDSYPRVQAGRLRRLLELHYHRQNDDLRPIRLRLAPVGYEIVVADSEPSIGRPDAPADRTIDQLPQPIEESLPDQVPPTPQPLTSTPLALIPVSALQTEPTIPLPTSPSPYSTMTGRRWWLKYIAAAVVGAMVVAVLVAAYSFWTKDKPDSRTAPTLEIAVTGTAPVTDMQQLRGWIMAQMSPSWVYRIADPIGREGPANEQPQGVSRYRLNALVSDSNNGRTVQLVLTNTDYGEIVWTRILPPTTGTRLIDALEPTIAELSSPTGVIANAELVRFGNDDLGSYGCTLVLEQFMRSASPERRATLSPCVADGLRRNANDPKLLVARAILQFNRSDRNSDVSRGSLVQSYADVQRAVTLAPDDPFVALAQARYLFLMGDCRSGKARALQALQAWPLLARGWASTGNFLFECNDPQAMDFSRRARALQGGQSSTYGLVMIFDALERNDVGEANRVATDININDQSAQPYVYLSLAVLAAANDERAEAWRYWVNVAQGLGVDPLEPEAVMRRFQLGQRQSTIALRYLRPIIDAQRTEASGMPAL